MHGHDDDDSDHDHDDYNDGDDDGDDVKDVDGGHRVESGVAVAEPKCKGKAPAHDATRAGKLSL